MRFKTYYLTEAEQLKDWKGYINRIPALKNGIEILKKLEKYGKAYIVGGAVRDIISGEKEPDDIDISTNVPMEKIESMFDTHDIGANKDFGIVVIKYKSESYEIAQFRRDGTYTDGRRPDKIEVLASFKGDAERRDFTINAMAVDSKGNIIDYFDGTKDIKNKLLKTVGDPDKRFSEDYLRMLRAVRFSSRLGMDIDPDTASAIKRSSINIKKISPERISKELLKMAKQKGTKFADAIVQLDKVGLLQHILPEIYKMKEFEHEKEHHPEGGVYDHTLSALRANDSDDYILNLAILFHDIGKVNTKTITPEGRIQYLLHAREGADMIDDISARLKLTNNTRDAIKFSALNHMKIHELTKMSNNKIIKLMNDPHWDTLLAVGQMDAKARGELFKKAEWDAIKLKIDQITKRYESDDKNIDALTNIRKVVNGDLVMKIKKITKPSKKVGDYISATVEWIVNNNIDVKNVKKIERFIKEL